MYMMNLRMAKGKQNHPPTSMKVKDLQNTG